MTYFKYFAISMFLLVLSPLSALAGGVNYAGTDLYLRNELGLTSQELTAIIALSDRKPFERATGAVSLTDPLGDVLDNLGRTTTLRRAWGDIQAAALAKQAETNSWSVRIDVGADIPAPLPPGADISVMFDADGSAANNATEGLTAGSDRVYHLSYQDGWKVNAEAYNPSSRTWEEQSTSATAAVEGDIATLNIPFSELPSDTEPEWRVLTNIEENGASQVDVAPTTGFPEPKSGDATDSSISSDNQNADAAVAGATDEASEEIPASSNVQKFAAIALIVGAALVLGTSLWRARGEGGTEA